jgi:hypothetical protein
MINPQAHALFKRAFKNKDKEVVSHFFGENSEQPHPSVSKIFA